MGIRMKRKTILFTVVLILLLVFPSIVLAQDSGISIRLSRDNGYGGFNNDIQGTFSIKASGPEDLVEVQFYMDDVLMAVLDSPPFNLQFHTGNYPDGLHTIYVIGVLADGTELRSNEKVNNFLSGKEAMSSTINMVVPILVVVGIFALGGALLPILTGKKGKAKPLGEYGVEGGAVCTKCGLPFSRSVLSPNMVVGKLSSCPHCRKWQIARRASGEALNTAEERLRADSEEGQMESSNNEGERINKLLDDSQFED